MKLTRLVAIGYASSFSFLSAIKLQQIPHNSKLTPLDYIIFPLETVLIIPTNYTLVGMVYVQLKT